MATIPASPVARSRPLVGKFYVTMAAIMAAVAFTGFAGTYWLQLPFGTFNGSPMLHLHGLLFSLWTLFFLSQALLVANGRLRNHKAWGLAGISLATAMLFTGLAVAIHGLEARLEAGYGDAARAFTIVPVTAVLMFAGFVLAALLNLRRPEWHKRFMLVATVNLLQAAVARFFFLANTGGGPGMRPGMGPPQPVEFTMAGAFIIDLLIVAAIVHDWRKLGRPHPAYLWGLMIVLAVQLSRPALSRTETWFGITDFLVRFGG